jgi:hypothetical protein
MRRLLLPLALLIAVLAVPATGQAYSTGISDQQAATFANPDYAPLKLKFARYIAPYDVMDVPAERAELDAWLTAARAANQRILVAFEHSYRQGRQRRLPSVAEFKRHLRKFRRAYPFVREISPWNEVNRCSFVLPDGSYQGQPTCRKPKRVAEYYMAARQVFPGRTIVGVDILDGQNVNGAVRFLRSFLRYAHPRPKVIGFHNYSDTNRFSTSRTKRILSTFGGKIWLTETGGIVKFMPSFPFSPSRAARALGCMFTLAKSNRRIQRLYVYQFHSPADPATARFDAGLINPDNSVRPGYQVVKNRTASPCRP